MELTNKGLIEAQRDIDDYAKACIEYRVELATLRKQLAEVQANRDRLAISAVRELDAVRARAEQAEAQVSRMVGEVRAEQRARDFAESNRLAAETALAARNEPCVWRWGFRRWEGSCGATRTAGPERYCEHCGHPVQLAEARP